MAAGGSVGQATANVRDGVVLVVSCQSTGFCTWCCTCWCSVLLWLLLISILVQMMVMVHLGDVMVQDGVLIEMSGGRRR